MLNQPFSPAQGQTQAVSVTATHAEIGVDENAKQVRVLNPNAFPVYVRFSVSTNPAAASAPIVGTPGDYPIGPNSSEVVTKADTFGTMSLIADVGKSGTVYVTTGEGFQSAAA
ncbi:hypothetical protein [Burkholderia thailandensis]|uniref:hypothetical protein n=1 Tax=Burkholderia thailandensis TaxID=57975 RepID=UPI00107ECB3F|nr:hypothetical protein [Burkholderia thailandensis]TGB34399.1 hypothetical protein C6946_07160 [Burkholderia thailandensis]